MIASSVDKSPVRLGIVGCGMIAKVHAEAATRTHGRVRFVSCADKDLETARAFAARHGCNSAHDGIKAMLDAGDLDGVVLCTWPTQHHEHIYQMMDRGVRHILCEKALTTTGPLAAEVMQRTRQAGVTVIEAFMLRYHPYYLMLKGLLPEAGPIDTVRAGFQEYDPEEEDISDGSRNWRQVKAAGGGVAFDFTCYSIHACADLIGSLPEKVSFEGEVGRYDTLVRLHGHIRYENGVVALIHSSRRGSICKEVEVNARDASLELPIAYGFTVPSFVNIRRRTGRSNATLRDEFLEMPGMPDGHDDYISARYQLEHFADIIRGASPRIDLAETVVNMFTTDAILKSVETGDSAPVLIPDAVRDAWQARRTARGMAAFPTP